MPIVNYNQIYYLYSDNNRNEIIEIKSSKTAQGFGGITRKFRDFQEIPAYYLEFNSAQSLGKFKLSSFINESTLQKIINQELILVLNNSYESFHDVVESIYENIIINQNIPEKQILLCTESADITNEINRCSKKYNKGKIKSEWLRQGEFNIFTSYNKNLKNHKIKTLVMKTYDKKFLSFNRRWRPHRATLVGLLKGYNLLDNGYVSLGKSDDNKNWLTIWDEIYGLSGNNSFVNNCLKQNKNNIINIPPLYIDNNNLIVNCVDLQANTIKYYENTYFSVVTETNFYTNVKYLSNQTGRFLSEKVFKPIACKHPFIIVSVPNFLEKLKELGYKTFSPYINEYYDTVLDDNERLHAIILEIERLCNLNDEQLQVFLNGVRDIVEHNHNVLLSKKIFHDKFYE